MNGPSFEDNQLQAFEARLAALAPKVSDDDRSELLYQCAFAAGRKSAGRSVHPWQLATAALLLLLLGTSLPLVRQNLLVARHAPVPPPSKLETPARNAATEETPEPDLLPRPPVEVALDAWQLRDTSGDKLSHELARFEKQDDSLRSLAMGVLRTRELP